MDDSERVWNGLLRVRGTNDAVDIAGIGALTVRTYEAYEGRNPRTGERVHVPAKHLPFFVAADDLREQVNSDGPGSAIADELRAGKTVLLGCVGGLLLRRKGERVGRDPQSGVPVTIPARAVVTFIASVQLQRALADESPLGILSERAVDEAFASIDEVSPIRSLEALDEAFDELAMEHQMHDLLFPDEREEMSDGTIALADGDGDLPRWYLHGGQVVEMRDDGEHAYDIASWAQDILTVSVIREVSRRTPDGEVLSVRDIERVLDRLSTKDAFSIGDLPF
jgi:nucleoid DNA-binding protein